MNALNLRRVLPGQRALFASATLGLSLTGASCTAPEVGCSSSQECRDAFGFGSVCVDSGYCEFATLPARCDSTLPSSLFGSAAGLDDALVVASVFDRSLDNVEAQAVRLAFEQVRDEVAVQGKTFALIECNYEENDAYDELDYAGAVQSIGTYLVDELGVPAIVGPYTSSQATALFDAVGGGVFIMSPAATSPALTFIDGGTKTDASPGSLWRTAPPDSLQGEVAALDMISRGSTRVAVVHESGAYGTGLAEIFQEAFAGGGRSVVVTSYENPSQLAEAIASVKLDNALDEVFFISSEVPDYVTFLNAAVLDGFERDPEDPLDDKRIFFPDGAAYTDVIDGTAGASALYDQLRGTRPSVDITTLNYSAFSTAYIGRWSTDPSASIYAAYAYDAAWTTMYAAVWSLNRYEAVTPLGLGQGMRRMSDKASGRKIDIRPSSWSNLTGFYADGLGVDITGVSGSLDYDPATEETTAPIEVWVVENGDFAVVETIEP